jgi:large subunit ribosomal protein L3
MVKKYRPRAGSLAFYPRKRAKKETASFSSFPNPKLKEGEKAKPLNFLGYKAGMTHALGKDSHEKGVTFGHEIAIATTVLECPPLKVFGVRAYGRAKKGFYGSAPLMDVFASGVDKSFLRKVPRFMKPGKKKPKQGKEDKAGRKTFADLEKAREKLLDLRLLCHSQPGKAGFGKKKPDVCELALSGSIDEKLAFAKEKLGKDILVKEVFSDNDFADVRAVTKGKGMQGPVKRFGVKTHRPKAKKQRVVGSIGPWNPSTVMWQVARPGQMGYHARTEFNKKILKVGAEADLALANQKGGFKNYGLLSSEFLVVAGSVAGPAKRAVSLRHCIRPVVTERHKIESLDYLAGGAAKAEAVEAALDAEAKVEHVAEKKEEKKEVKSVADEIAAAAKGDQKREKQKEK